MRVHAARMTVALAVIVLCRTARPALATDCIQGKVADQFDDCVRGATVTLSQGGRSTTTQDCATSGFSYQFTALQCDTPYPVFSDEAALWPYHDPQSTAIVSVAYIAVDCGVADRSVLSIPAIMCPKGVTVSTDPAERGQV